MADKWVKYMMLVLNMPKSLYRSLLYLVNVYLLVP